MKLPSFLRRRPGAVETKASGFFALTATFVPCALGVLALDPGRVGLVQGGYGAGLLAGAGNAALRKQGFFPEGVVLVVLAVNLLSPTLDRLAFAARGLALQRAARRPK